MTFIVYFNSLINIDDKKTEIVINKRIRTNWSMIFFK